MADRIEHPMTAGLRKIGYRAGPVGAAADELDRLHGLLNVPGTDDFLEDVRNEAGHQVERWGAPHDRGKEPEDWFWLIGYLAGKAVRAQREGDVEKAKHHTISSAAALLNWHRHLSGTEQTFTPGLSDVERHLEETFGGVADA